MTHTPKIGAFVLETLTTGMYTDPLDSIREFVQNGYDSIRAAEELKFLGKNQGEILVTIAPEKKSLTIRDNGAGIPATSVAEKLLNIGMSSKDIGKDAGFRGIGRLAGIAYCKKLHFRTSYKYEDSESTITFDCDGIRKTISPAMREKGQIDELADVIKKNTKQEVAEAKKDLHYLEVSMEGILSNDSPFLDIKELDKYLGQVAPVEYDGQAFVYAKTLEKWLSQNDLVLPHVTLIIKSAGVERQIYKPFRTHYKTRDGKHDFHIKDIAFFPEKLPKNPSFWLWYSKTDLLGTFDDDRVAGLRFRKNNIAIGGPKRVAELFAGTDGRLNAWMMGEIHILDETTIPNARRDGFEPTDGWQSILSQLKPFITEHIRSCRAASSASSRPTAKVLASAQSLIQDTKSVSSVGFASNDEKTEYLSKLIKEIDRVEKAMEREEAEAEKKKLKSVLQSMSDLRKNLETTKLGDIAKFRTDLDRKQKKLLIEVQDLIYTVLSQSKCPNEKKCLEAIKKKLAEQYQTKK